MYVYLPRIFPVKFPVNCEFLKFKLRQEYVCCCCLSPFSSAREYKYTLVRKKKMRDIGDTSETGRKTKIEKFH